MLSNFKVFNDGHKWKMESSATLLDAVPFTQKRLHGFFDDMKGCPVEQESPCQEIYGNCETKGQTSWKYMPCVKNAVCETASLFCDEQMSTYMHHRSNRAQAKNGQHLSDYQVDRICRQRGWFVRSETTSVKQDMKNFFGMFNLVHLLANPLGIVHQISDACHTNQQDKQNSFGVLNLVQLLATPLGMVRQASEDVCHTNHWKEDSISRVNGLHCRFKTMVITHQHAFEGSTLLRTLARILVLVWFIDAVTKQSVSSKRFSADLKDTSKHDCGEKVCHLREHKAWHFIFRFHNFPKTNLTVYPFSLNQYASEIVNNHRVPEELMQYEWARFLSFKNFPLEASVSPLRLAQAGFYYTGRGVEVKCFCCGLTNGNWAQDETAVEVHRRLSPICNFINGGQTDNVNIHNSDYYTDILQDNGRRAAANFHDNINSSSPGPGATGGPSDIPRSASQSDTSSTPRTRDASREKETNIQNSSNQSAENNNREQTSQNMKHPQYADVTRRHESFHSSNFAEIQNPMTLAEAGFFYAGIKDFVRCYFCGVGLKNWEKDDDPWSEHARWSQSCGHLLNSRPQSNATANGSIQNGCPANPNDSIKTNLAENTKKATGEADKVAATEGASSQQPKVEMNATQSVIEMGYSKDMVTRAVQKYRETYGADPKNAADILEIVINMDDARDADNIVTTSSRQTSPESNQDSETNHSAEEKSTDNQKSPDALKEGARVLLEENRKMKEQMMCKICMDKDADAVFLPCGHMVSCHACAGSLRKCAVCRKLIRGIVRVYQS